MTPLLVTLCMAVHIIDARWIEESTKLSRSDAYQAIGFYNHTISIIGGMDYPRQMVQYNTRTHTKTIDIANEAGITTDIECSGHGWVQENEWLYMIPMSGDHFAIYNLGIFYLFVYKKCKNECFYFTE
eukprot:36261_1